MGFSKRVEPLVFLVDWNLDCCPVPRCHSRRYYNIFDRRRDPACLACHGAEQGEATQPHPGVKPVTEVEGSIQWQAFLPLNQPTNDKQQTTQQTTNNKQQTTNNNQQQTTTKKLFTSALENASKGQIHLSHRHSNPISTVSSELVFFCSDCPFS